MPCRIWTDIVFLARSPCKWKRLINTHRKSRDGQSIHRSNGWWKENHSLFRTWTLVWWKLLQACPIKCLLNSSDISYDDRKVFNKIENDKGCDCRLNEDVKMKYIK